MKNMRRISALLLCLVVVFLAGMTAYAHDVPDLNRPCSFTVTMRNGEKPIGGGKLSIYLVGEVAEDDGDYSFTPAAGIGASGETLTDLEDAELASRLKTYVEKQKIPPLEKVNIPSTGVTEFTDLKVGLYLVVQSKAASGYAPVEPFLISLPYMEDGVYKYELAAEPKTDLEPVHTDPPSTDPKLPQTGQLWWPVPMLICGGLAMVVIGFALNRRKGSDER